MLKEHHVIGDVALRFLDKEGNECDTELKERTISISLEQFRKIPVKVTLASGEEKAHAVLAALKGGLIDVLIVDIDLVELYSNSIKKGTDCFWFSGMCSDAPGYVP